MTSVIRGVSVVAAAVVIAVSARCASGEPATNAVQWTICSTEDSRQVVIGNVGYAPDAQDVSALWTAYRDGSPFASGAFPLHVFRQGPVRPGQAVTSNVPRVVYDVGSRGGEMALCVNIERADPESGRRFKLARGWIEIPSPKLQPLPKCTQAAVADGGGERWTLSGGGMAYSFDRGKAMLSSIRAEGWFGREWLASPVEFVLPEGFEPVWAKMSDPVLTNGMAAVASAVRLERKNGTPDGFDLLVRWIVRGDGRLVCQSAVRPDSTNQPCANASFRFRLVAGRSLMQYYGKLEGDEFAVRGDVAPDGDGAFRAEFLRALVFDSGWNHLSFAAMEPRFAAEVHRCGEESLLTMSFAPDGGEGGVPVSFVIGPDKRLAAWRGLNGVFSAECGEGNNNEKAADAAVQAVAE